ncbi:MAG: hypothetical protein V1773_14170 [bacterium]
MKNLIFVFVISAFITGCYTQVAVKDKQNEDYQQYAYSQQDGTNDEGVIYDTVYYDDNGEYQDAAENESRYSGFEDQSVKEYTNDYIQIALPVVVINSDPFWDNWNYFWYINSWYSPTNYFYDGFYGFGWDYYPYYHHYWDPYWSYNYYGGYYGGYCGNNYYGNNYSSGTHPGKTRDNDGGRGTKTRNSFGDKSGNTTITRTREIKSITKRDLVTRNNDVKTGNVVERKKDDLGISTSRIKIQRNEVKNDSETGREKKIIVRQKDNTQQVRDSQPKVEDNRVTTRQNKLDNETPTSTHKKIYIKRDNENRTSTQYKQPVKNDGNSGNQTRETKTNTNSGTKNDYKAPVKQNREPRNDTPPPTREYRAPVRNDNPTPPPVNSGNQRSNNSSNNNNSRNDGNSRGRR